MTNRLHLYRSEWAGVETADFTLEAMQQHCWQISETILAHGWSCLVAYDTRFLSAQYARYLYLFLVARGVRASLSPVAAPTPTVYRALEQKRADTALMVGAGNRPHWYNGLLFITPEPLPEHPAPVAPLADVTLPSFPPQELSATEQTQIDLRAPYLDYVRGMLEIDLIRRSTLTVFVDPMNGTTSGYLPALIGEGAQTKAVEINRETDPLFGRLPPQPFETGVPRLRKLVKESDSHLGLAISADGRVLRMTDNSGELVPPLEVALLLAQYLSRQHRQRGTVVLPLPDDTAVLRHWEAATGLKVEAFADPAARINEIVQHDRADLLVGTTPLGEITIGRYGDEPDAVLAAMVLIELVARAGGRTRAQLDDVRQRLSGA